MRRLAVDPVVRGRRHLVLRYGVGDLRFSTSYWYDDVDFRELEERYGVEAMRKVYFHLLAFQANKAGSLAPTEIDWGPYSDLITDAFWACWEPLFHNVWGVWRLENDLPDYSLPRPPAACRAPPARPGWRSPRDGQSCCSCAVAARTAWPRCGSSNGLESSTTPSSTPTPYGRGERQHRLVDELVSHCRPRRTHRAWIVDDVLDAPIGTVYPELGIRRIVAAETVASYWTALPVALQHGYTEVGLGITRSTDEHNLVWDRTGEEINYLWGMSGAAERLLHSYVRAELVSNMTMFHLLRPIYDVNVFALLRNDLDAVPSTRVPSTSRGAGGAPSASTCG